MGILYLSTKYELDWSTNIGDQIRFIGFNFQNIDSMFQMSSNPFHTYDIEIQVEKAGQVDRQKETHKQT